MASSSSVNNLQASFRASVTETIEDPISLDLMTRAVTVIPCGHTFNEDTVIQCLARDKLCPLDRQPIERYVPNYAMRQLAEAAGSHSIENEAPSSEAQVHLEQGKELFDQEKYEEAVNAFLQALQISPTFEKAQAYLDLSLKRASPSFKDEEAPSSGSPQPLPRHLQKAKEKVREKEPTQNKSSPKTPKEQYIHLLLKLLDKPQIKSDAVINSILVAQLEELMTLETTDLIEQQQQAYKWTQQLFIDDEIMQYVVEKLKKMHGEVPYSDKGATSSSSLAFNNQGASSRFKISTQYPMMWNSSVTLDELMAVPIQAFLAPLNEAPQNAILHCNLARAMYLQKIDSYNLNGRQMTQQQLYLKAIDLDPRDASAYYNLGTTLPKGGSIRLLNGERMTREELLRR